MFMSMLHEPSEKGKCAGEDFSFSLCCAVSEGGGAVC